GEKVPYVSTDREGNSSVQFEEAVLRLEITPHVIENQNLKMKIVVKKDQVDTTRNVLGNPFIIKKQTETTLIVADKETIVISGLTMENITDSTSGIPGLKNIPGLGWLFKGQSKEDNLQEVLIFITPTILPPQQVTVVGAHGAKKEGNSEPVK
ncbi:MAG: type II and III secretion system protein, partial [Smithellaceae bacterium]|nr:type II and III secretion system protein [Smithellaceae bacterium]